MKRYTFIFLLSALSLFSFSCDELTGQRVRGNGHIATREVNVTDFKNVDVSGAVDLHISQGDVQPVKIETDDNLMEYVEVKQEGQTIRIFSRKGYNLSPSHKIKIYLTTAAYGNIDLSGACDVTSEGKINNPDNISFQVSGAGDIKVDIHAPQVSAEVSGAGSVSMKGETKSFILDLTGAGKARCYDLQSENTKVDITGAGEAEVFASVKLDADISGAGSVRYKGGATGGTRQVSGAGSIKAAE